MKKPNKAVGVITAILATLLSIVFVLFTFATALSGAVLSVAKPANVATVVQNIDYVEVLQKQVPQGQQIKLGDVEIPPEAVSKLMETQAVKELITTYADAVSELLIKEELPHGITADQVCQIADRHLDEVLEIAAEYIVPDMPKEELRSQLQAVIYDNADQIVEALPKPQELIRDIPADTLEAARVAANPAALWALIAVCAVLALLVVVCRLYRFGWMLWIGINSIIIAAMVGLLGASLGVVLSMEQVQLGQAATLLFPVADFISAKLLLGAAVLLGIGVLGIVAGAVLRSKANKKARLAALAEPAVEVLPEAEPEVEAEAKAEAVPEPAEAASAEPTE